MILSQGIVEILLGLNDKYVLLDFKNDNYSSLLDAKFSVFNKVKGILCYMGKVFSEEGINYDNKASG